MKFNNDITKLRLGPLNLNEQKLLFLIFNKIKKAVA